MPNKPSSETVKPQAPTAPTTPAAQAPAPAPTEPSTPVEAPAQAKAITRVPVQMVLKNVGQIHAAVAADDDVPAPRKGRTAQKLDDELQKAFREYVKQSHENGHKWLTLTVPAEAEREVIKRLRLAASEAGYGLSLGETVPHGSNVKVPFKAGVPRKYKKD
jgi:hypothetical protein